MPTIPGLSQGGQGNSLDMNAQAESGAGGGASLDTRGTVYNLGKVNNLNPLVVLAAVGVVAFVLYGRK